LRRLAGDGYGILFLDEISTDPPAVQVALLRVVLERVVGDFELPADVAWSPPPIRLNKPPTAGTSPHHWPTASATSIGTRTRQVFRPRHCRRFPSPPITPDALGQPRTDSPSSTLMRSTW
jgi:hypothetical protein